MAIDTERAATPAKRKLEDRDSPRQEPEEKRMKPSEVNGGVAVKRESESASSSVPAAAAVKKRRRYSQPPIWAQDARKMNSMPTNANFVLQKRVHSHLNGKKENARPSRHASPETNRGNPPPHVPAAEPGPQEILGPWEPSLTGLKPFEDVSRQVADFLFLNVINTPDMREISSRGIQFEIEAKLGTLIDRDTNQRVDRGIASECVLMDNSRVAFKSSMTEVSVSASSSFLSLLMMLSGLT